MRSVSCLSCGGPVAPCLERGGSPRCHECREAGAPIDAELLEQAVRRPGLRAFSTAGTESRRAQAKVAA